MSCPRIYPIRKPPNHQPPTPRWTLSLPTSTTIIHIRYVGLQSYGAPPSTIHQVWAALTTASTSPAPFHTETLTSRPLHNAPPERIHISYFTHPLPDLCLASLHATLPSDARDKIGIWSESLSIPIQRLETLYSSPSYTPGLALLPSAELTPQDRAAYWGAARDRIPESGHDLFEREASWEPPSTAPRGLGQRVAGHAPANIVYIRSGQAWGECEEEERASYEGELEPVLQRGLEFLASGGEGGAVGMRYLSSLDEYGKERKETCGVGFFASLGDLEGWAKRHATHLEIWKGALRHLKRFGEDAELALFHEVAVLKEGETWFEYVNCRAGTGVMESLPMEVAELGLSIPMSRNSAGK